MSVRTRIATAAPLIGGFLAALFWAPPMLWAGLMLVILFLAAAEWAALHKFDPVPTYAFALLVACIGLFAWEMDWPDKALAYFPAALFWLGVPFLLRRPEHMLPAFVSLALAALLLVSTWMAIVSLRQQSPGVLLAVVGLVIVADSAAYFAGRRFGRHKLAPRISPGKTWEGAAGATVGVSLYVLFLLGFLPDLLPGPGPAILALAWALLALSVLGDLFESVLKRQAGVKDSGNLLPGHGGVLDRIDSLTAVLPVAALLWIGLT